LERFAADLEKEVGARLPRPVRCVGFASRNLGLSLEERHALSRDLFRCHVFVPLITDTYLNSEWCGRELTGFLRRIEAAGQYENFLLLPVKWRGRTHFPVPPPLSHLLSAPVDDEHVAKGGMMDLLRTKRRREYQVELYQIAGTVAHS